MESEARYALVGVVVLALTAALVMSVLWLSGETEDEARTYYSVYFRKHSLAGLQENCDVTMRGIKVGSVRYLQIAPDDIELVKVTVEVKASTPVKQDARAVIQRNLLTGVSSIDLIGSTSRAPFIEATPGERYPVIPEGETTFGAIQDSLPDMIEKGSQALNRANDLLSDDNRAALSATLHNVSLFTGQLAESRVEIVRSLEMVSNLSVRLNEFVINFDKRAETMFSTVKQTAESINAEVTAMTRSVSQAANTLSSTLEHYEEPRSLITGPGKNALGPGEKR